MCNVQYHMWVNLIYIPHLSFYGSTVLYDFTQTDCHDISLQLKYL